MMVMTKIITTLLVLFLGVSCQEQIIKESDIRGLNWGINKDEVIQKESCELEQPRPLYQGYFGIGILNYQIDILDCYEDSIGDYYCSLKFYFVDDKLFEISYDFETLEELIDRGLTKVDFIKREKYIYKLLTKQFGKFTDYKENNLNGDFFYEKIWENNRTFVFVNQSNDERLTIYFVSKDFKNTYEKKSQGNF
jgi:hypothetical protein